MAPAEEDTGPGTVSGLRAGALKRQESSGDPYSLTTSQRVPVFVLRLPTTMQLHGRPQIIALPSLAG